MKTMVEINVLTLKSLILPSSIESNCTFLLLLRKQHPYMGDTTVSEAIRDAFVDRW